ncbi:MAG: 30S ribosomal protein S4 [Deltaproteobacteria bacterium]|nr:30S ribosomal protein S4 [Deltaproteobacteria bacterium]
MARYTGPVCKLCRREAMKLFLKGERCYTDKCSFDRRPYPPGQHGQRRMKFTEYGIRLREKQKVRRIYGMMEKQFHAVFNEAERVKGVTGENLLALLERRLDSAVYRLGLARTRSEARQLVRHRHFSVNGHTVNIPSFLVNPGDKIQVRERSRQKAVFTASVEQAGRRGTPEWLELDSASLEGTIKAQPNREALTLPIQEQLIVEFYSR